MDNDTQSIVDVEREEPNDNFSTWIAILIAVVTLVGAWIGWRVAVVSGSAGDAQTAGLNAALNVESTLTNQSISLYKEYRVYTEFLRYQTLIELQASTAPTEATPSATTPQAEESELAAVQMPFFLARYLTHDGNFDKQRQLGEAWTEAAQQIDLEPAPHFMELKQLQFKTEFLVSLFIVLAFSLFFYTFAEGLSPQRRILRYLFTTLGTLTLLFSVAATFWIERW